MILAPDTRTYSSNNSRLLKQLEHLASAVSQIEYAYPAADLGLTEICRDALARVSTSYCEAPSSVPTEKLADKRYELQILDAQSELDLVPRHEYRRKRRQLSRHLRSSQLTGTPILQRVIGAGSVLLDGLDEGLYLLGDFAENLYRQRFSISPQEDDVLLRMPWKRPGDQFTGLS